MVTEYIPFAPPFEWHKMSLSPSVGGTFTPSMIISISAQPVSIGNTRQSAVNVTAIRARVASLKVATGTGATVQGEEWNSFAGPRRLCPDAVAVFQSDAGFFSQTRFRYIAPQGGESYR